MAKLRAMRGKKHAHKGKRRRARAKAHKPHARRRHPRRSFLRNPDAYYIAARVRSTTGVRAGFWTGTHWDSAPSQAKDYATKGEAEGVARRLADRFRTPIAVCTGRISMGELAKRLKVNVKGKKRRR